MTNGRRLLGTVAVASSLIALACVPHAAAQAAGAPTLSASTTVGDHTTMMPLAHGGWTLDKGIWTATIRSASVAGGTTTYRGSWTSPTFDVRPRQIYFTSNIDVSHQGQSDHSSYYSQKARTCTVHGNCDRWLSISTDGLPQQYTASPPYAITTGTGFMFKLGAQPRHATYVQWRFVAKESGLDEQEFTAQIAAGRAAKALSKSTSGR